MHRLQIIAIALSLTTVFATGCGGSATPDPATGGDPSDGTAGGTASEGGQGGEGTGAENEFQLQDSDTAGQAHGDRPSEIEASATHAAMRFFVVDPETGPIVGTVIKMTSPDGVPYFTPETDSVGYTEVLVPVGQRYQLEYLSLGRRTTNATVNVAEGPNQDVRLTLRRRGWRPTPPAPTPEQPNPEPEPQRFTLEGVLFDTGNAHIKEESFPRLDRVVEYMTYMTQSRIRISGHTDNVGNPRGNMRLSEARAEAVRTYLIEHDIDGSRVEAVGHGDENPVATNDTEEGRAQNRRIEAVEL